MSKYEFCRKCEHITKIKVRGIHSYHVEQWDCPARFNPYEPIIDNTDISQRNPHACPKHDRFLLMEQIRKTGYKPPELVSLSPPDEPPEET